jgi:Tfp pilus assembly protein PilO
MSTNRILAIVSALAVVAILGLGWFLGVSPLLAGAAQAGEETAAVQQANQAQEARVAVMRDQFDNLADLEDELQDLRLSVPGELDSDTILAYLAGIQRGAEVPIESIVIGEAVPYGQTAGVVVEEGTQSATPAAAPDGVYSVPVTITFGKGVPASTILAFAGALQNGPRLFLVTAVTRPAGSDDTSGTITAYMFVVADRDESPGSAAGALEEAFSRYRFEGMKEWGAGKDAADGTTPTPESEPTQAPTPSPTSTP